MSLSFRLGCAASLLMLGAASPPQDAEGVAVGTMWKILGATTYATCLRAEYSPVPATPEARAQLLEQALETCDGRASSVFSGGTYNGGSFPRQFLREASRMERPTRDYLVPILRSLPPSEFETKERLRFYVTQDDGSRVEFPGDRMQFDEDSMLFAEIVEPASGAAE